MYDIEPGSPSYKTMRCTFQPGKAFVLRYQNLQAPNRKGKQCGTPDMSVHPNQLIAAPGNGTGYSKRDVSRTLGPGVVTGELSSICMNTKS